MSALDPRTPVLVGGGQLNQREDPVEPVDMIVRAVRLAAEDAGAPALAEVVQSIRVIGMLSWRYRDPGALVGERLGAPVRHTVYTGAGGCYPQALVSDACEDVLAGRCDVAVVAGAEAWRTRMAFQAQGERPAWTRQGDDVALPESRPDVPMRHESEVIGGVDRPAYVYPLFEQALRISAGRTQAQHRDHIAALWSRFSEVAVDNPYAWVRTPHTAEQIATATASNRMIAAPYTKLMNSNNSVEQAAAVIICSAETAERRGVPRDRWVFPVSGADASDTGPIAERPALDGSPAIRYAGAAVLELAGLSVADLGPIDIYSCFPSAVQVAAKELGLPVDDPARPLTITGGLTFAGGPWNNYSTHAIASMIAAVRGSDRPGLVTANSGYLTKHSLGIYSSTPPAKGFRRRSAQPETDAVPTTPLSMGVRSDVAQLESWTVVHDREGRPESSHAALMLPDGSRTLARNDDAGTAAHLAVAEAEGTKVRVTEAGRFDLV
ncbi:acetyl-CoA acetyltransferase [Nocardioides ultimimeridianus]